LTSIETLSPRRRRIAIDGVLVATFAAIYIVFRSLPTYPMLGVPGATFKAGDIVAPLFGILLGPLLGPLSITIGTFVAFSTGAPPLFLGWDFLPAATSAAMTGLITRRRRGISMVLNSFLILVFLSLPYTAFYVKVGAYSVPFVWLHVFGLVLLISPLSSFAASKVSFKGIDGKGSRLLDLSRNLGSLFVLSLIATLAQHIMGGILTQTIVGLNFNRIPGKYSSWQAFWTFVFWVYPIERTATAVVAALVAAPVIVALKRSRMTEYLP
jgi:hypothetical protein